MKLKIMLFRYYISLLFLLFFISCKGNLEEKNLDINNATWTLSDNQIDAISSKRILFGHASVGNNIIQGIEEIIKQKEFNKICVRVLKNKNEKIIESCIYHCINGRNGFPKLKCDNFKNLLSSDNLGNNLDIAFFKFCYVDFERDSNVEEIFKYYVKTVDEIQTKYPHLKIIHVTSPLYAHSYTLKSKIKNIIIGDIANVKRNQYNDLLRKKYEDNAPIYDLAKIESTKPNGEREYFSYDDNIIFSLTKIFTDDGGHLNKLGRRFAAKELLDLLASITLM